MKKTIKKSPSKRRATKATKNLDVKPAKGGTVRGGSLNYFINLNPVKGSPEQE